MRNLSAANELFNNHPRDLYATDVTFQQTNRLAGNHQESKGMFRAKRKLYGYKMEYLYFLPDLRQAHQRIFLVLFRI